MWENICEKEVKDAGVIDEVCGAKVEPEKIMLMV